MTAHDLLSLSGIGPATAEALVAAGFSDRASIASATVEQLVAVRGFAEARASALIAEARTGEADGESVAAEPAGRPDVESPERAEDERPTSARKAHKKLRARHVDLKKRAKKARRRSKTATTKKKRKRWAAEADRLARKAKKAKKRLAKLG